MHILIVPDSFKGSTSSIETANCIAEGVRTVFPNAELKLLPAADGGEGTVDALLAAVGGKRISCPVSDPLGRPINASFGLLSDGWAVIEMAQASGLPLLSQEERAPAVTTTFGTGQLIRKALDLGCRHILVGIGGSATNDGGAGMAAALGIRLLDKNGHSLPPGGEALERLAQIDCSSLDPRIAETEFIVASDVTNPLCGPQGASAVYGPQKGTTPDQVIALDHALSHYGAMLHIQFGRDIAALPGAGAAGGLGAGLIAFCNATLKPGIDIIFERLDLEEQIHWADLVITGEGRVDATSANGKLLSGIGRMARGAHTPVIALTGSAGAGSEQLQTMGIPVVLPIADGPLTLEQSLAQAPQLISTAAARAAHLIRIGHALSAHSF